FAGPTGRRVVLRNLEEAHMLKKQLVPGTRLVILGAGFIGCEVARTATNLDCEVDIVAIDPAPMVMPLGASIGEEIQRRHEAAGIRFHMGVSIERTNGTDHIQSVTLTDGRTLDADLLLETVGSVPNVGWLDCNG